MTRRFVGAIPRAKPLLIQAKYLIICASVLIVTSVRKPTTRWHGNPERRIRPVRYLDLRRTQPIYARVGDSK